MERVTMRKRGTQFLSLEVPGLAERRPSLVQGDFIFARLASEDENETTLFQVRAYLSPMVRRFQQLLAIIICDTSCYRI
jgi:hypothetical protein